MNEFEIRFATLNDCPAILDIYQHYVKHTAITFEYGVPTLEEMQARMKHIQIKYPYLVALQNNVVVGYAYASDFRYKDAYQWSPESTIYLNPQFCGKGIGKKLYLHLFEILRQQGFYNVFAGVALPNEASIALHLNLGFKVIGVYENIGYKFNSWHSTQWFQLILTPHTPNPIPPIKITDL